MDLNAVPTKKHDPHSKVRGKRLVLKTAFPRRRVVDLDGSLLLLSDMQFSLRRWSIMYIWLAD